MKAVVLAAGFGKRLRPLTVNRPKHILPLAGKPLVARTVEALVDSGVEEVGVLVGYRSELIADALRKIDQNRVKYIVQKNIAGTGAAVMECRSFLAGQEHFLVVYGDLTLDAGALKEFLSFFHGAGWDGAVAAVEVGETGAYGVVEARNSHLVRIREKEDVSGPINAGVYVLGSYVFEALERVGPSPRGEVELTDALNLLASSGRRIGVKLFEAGWWYDIGRPSDYLAANHAFLRRIYGEGVFLEGGVEVGDGTSVRGPVYLGRNVKVGSMCVLEGPAMVCDYSTIMAGSHVRRSILLENCVVGPESKVVDSILCEGSAFPKGLEVASSKFPAYVSEPGLVVEDRLRVV
ncbi:MAG: sugar phosphate nucleotidyltransferase [Candidatus Caldarchaeum sp.]